MKITTLQRIDINDLNNCVEETYGRSYNYQQQDGCKSRGAVYITVPCEHPHDYENESIPEEVNGNEMGVSWAAWLARDPKQQLNTDDKWARENGRRLFWCRNFYPSIDMVVNDLHVRGLLPAGEYQIMIDW